MRKRIEANIQSVSTNCDQMSFFEKKMRKKKHDNYRFRDKHHQANFQVSPLS